MNPARVVRTRLTLASIVLVTQALAAGTVLLDVLRARRGAARRRAPR